jgi:hypothetical protein
MKKVYTTLLALCTLAIGANAQSLAVKYDFSGNCGDSSNGNKHGSPTNITYTNDIAGVANIAVAFNGTSSYITIPNFVGTTVGSPFHNVAVSVWFKTNSKQKPSGIAYAGLESIGNYPSNFTPLMWIDSAGYLCSYFYAGSFTPVQKSTDTVNDNKWHHAIFYYYQMPPTTVLQKLYLDGKEVASYYGIKTGTPSYTNIYMGACNPRNLNGMPDAWMYFNGTMDNFRAYITPNGPFTDSFLHCSDFLITGHPQSQAKTLGSSASLSVSHTMFLNDTIYTYQWKKNGVVISGATDSILNIASVAATDTGDYVCEVKNNYNLTLTSNAAKLSLSTGISKVAKANEISTYPNPAYATINLSATGKIINAAYIYSIDGKLVKHIQQSGINTIDISSLTQGIYVLKLSCSGETFISRFTKQ